MTVTPILPEKVEGPADESEPPALVAILGERGFLHLYRMGKHNNCPSCGGAQWWVGRSVATCAFCDASIPIVTTAEPAPTPHIEEEAA